MQLKDHASFLGVEIGPGAADLRWTKARYVYPHLLAVFGPETRLFQDVCSVCPLLSSDLSLNLMRPKLWHSRQALFTSFRPHCSCEEVRAASKLMLTSVSSMSCCLSVCSFVHRIGSHPCCKKTTVAEPSSPSPGVGMKNTFSRRRPSALRPPVSWFPLWTASDAWEICLSTRCNPVPRRIEMPK